MQDWLFPRATWVDKVSFFRTDSSDAPGQVASGWSLSQGSLFSSGRGPHLGPYLEVESSDIPFLVLSVRVSIQGSPPAVASWWRFTC